MATTKNKNLFYLLYSKDKSVANSGYVCSRALDENQTSFDISGSEALITDSNGDILASLDLTSVHAAGITQYNVETKVLQPKSAYLLLGNEYGETYKSQFFKINEIISKQLDYQDYCNIKFDILYKVNGKISNVHVYTKPIRETYGSFVILVQNQLNKLKANISISIRKEDDTESFNKQIHYINFESTEEGYDFIIRNVILTPILKDDENFKGEVGEFYDSPFEPENVSRDFLIELLEKYKPLLIGNIKTDINYKLNCDIYKLLIYMSIDMVLDFNLFVYELDIIKNYFLPCFDTDGTLIFKKKLLEVIAPKYPEIHKKYFSEPLSRYNINQVYKILEEIKDHIFALKNAKAPSNCYENINKQINNVKYPNGALRGIVIIPDWPNDSDYEYCTLWTTHVADLIEICVPIEIEMLNKYFEGNIISNKKTTLFEKAIATVKINALIPLEKEQYFEEFNNLPLSDISSNDGFTNSFDNLYDYGHDNYDHVNNDFYRRPVSLNKQQTNGKIQYHDPDLYVNANYDDDDVWENNPNKNNLLFVDTHTNENVKTSIGLYKYMEYLSTNDLWTRIGTSYMNIAKDDYKQSKDKNLLLSLLIYNPNNTPIRIKYIIFS